MVWKKIKKFFPIIGIGLFIYILLKFDITKIFEEIEKVDIYLFAIAIFLTFLSLITQMLKWTIIAKFQGINIPMIEAFKINIIGFFYGFITPAKVGNIVRADYLKKYTQGDLNPGISNFILDKIFDLLSLITIVVIFSFSFRNVISINYFYVSLIILIGFIFAILIFCNKERSKNILRIFYNHFITKKSKDKMKEKFDSFYRHFPSKKYFLFFLGVNMLNWIVIYASIFFIGLSLGIDISFWNFLAIFPIATLVGYIPITIGGIGTREAVLISLMSLFNVESAKVVSMSILNILIGGIIPCITAIFLMMKKGNRMDEEIQSNNPSA
jgi:glycosyltransferase 2 family protein